VTRIEVNEPILSEVSRRANELRGRMAAQGTLVVNVLSSPGAGKTTLIAATARRLAPDYRLAALVGDIATDRDAQRLQPWMPAVQLTTGGACHLELSLVESGLARIADAGPLDFLFVENVGNLVCPASFDLGEHARVVLLAVTEGDDKPQKYPKAFRTARACVLSKIDLLPHVPFSPAAARADAEAIQPELEFFEVSALTGAGIESWCEFLVKTRRAWITPEQSSNR
jgi:hydrogenase nickel incorporation protein HypB